MSHPDANPLQPGDRPPQAARVAWLTGASGGLGQAIARALVVRGWMVAACFHRHPPESTDPSMLSIALDVTDEQSVARACNGILERFGRIDLLVNNAGIAEDSLLTQMSGESWDAVMDVNLKGAFLCSKAACRHMMRQRDGHVLNISSFAARRGHAGQSNYVASKAGLIGLTQSLAAELGPRNIRANVILPGVLPTPMTGSLTPEHREALIQANALRRLNDLGEVAEFVVHLASMRNVSGQVFQLDSRIARWT